MVNGAIVFSACSSDDGAAFVSDDLPSDTNKVRTVAVVAPLGDAATRTRLERTAQWFAENFKDEQQGDSFTTRPWLPSPLPVSRRSSRSSPQPLPSVGGDLQSPTRRYAVSSAGKETNKHAFFWPLTETDVPFSETLLSCYITNLGNNIELFHLQPNAALFSPNDLFGDCKCQLLCRGVRSADAQRGTLAPSVDAEADRTAIVGTRHRLGKSCLVRHQPHLCRV